MKLPSRKKCFQIIHKMEMMDHIIDHSVMVANVAACLCRHLKAENTRLNTRLVHAAALLHDITKTRSFETGEIHSQTGGDLMDELGYPEVGKIIRQHVILDHLDKEESVSEHEIVNYADKRVLHDQVVSLDRRLAYIKVRYGKNPEFRQRINQMWELTLDLESKLFRNLTFSPAHLADQILADALEQ